AQFDFAFFAMAVPTDLECEGRSVPRLSQANLSTSRIGRQITLLDNEAPRPLEIIRQPCDQKFSLNFAIVSRSSVSSHKLEIVNAMRSVSRLSRCEVERVVLNALATACGLCRLISGR